MTADETPTEVIGQAIDRLTTDYDTALAAAGGDEQMVTLYLPGEWVILARRVCELIVTEAMQRYRALVDRAAVEADPVACSVCGLGLWRIHVDPATGQRRTVCARCGMVCHV